MKPKFSTGLVMLYVSIFAACTSLPSWQVSFGANHFSAQDIAR